MTTLRKYKTKQAWAEKYKIQHEGKGLRLGPQRKSMQQVQVGNGSGSERLKFGCHIWSSGESMSNTQALNETNSMYL